MQIIIYPLTIGIPITLALLWVGINAKTKWKEAVKHFKAILFALPFTLLATIGPQTYQDYQIDNYKAFTIGIVTNIERTVHYRGGVSNNADVDYSVNGQIMHGRGSVPKDMYKIGDTVSIMYSSDIPEFFRIKQKN